MDATVRVDTAHRIGQISPLIYGQYLEHVADCIYPAMWDPDSIHTDEHGLRRDVIDAVRDAHIPTVRWPGGCFADTYHWRDGIGPRENRPARRNWHWGGLEPNSFGTDEFLTWCAKTGAQPYLTHNLGTGTLTDALRWVDYCNGTDPSHDVRTRTRNGHPAPYGVRLWGIGNEPWGPWEAGHTDAAHYAHTLANWARFLKSYDPNADVLAAGSAEARDPGWDRTVLETAGENIDHLTIHLYGCSTDRTTGNEFLPVAFTPVYFETRMRAMLELTREHGIRIALDEWNIRHYQPTPDGGHQLDRRSPRTLQDAVFAAGVLNAMIRLSPGVSLANHVFLANGNAILNTYADQLVKTPMYHLFRQYTAWMHGTAVHTETDVAHIPTPHPSAQDPGHHEHLDDLPTHSPYLDVTAALDEHQTLNLALINRHPSEPINTRTELPTGYRLTTAWILTDPDLYAVNNAVDPDRITPEQRPIPAATTTWTCPAHSVTLLRAERTTTENG